MADLAILNESQAVSVFNSIEAFQQAQRMVVPLMQSTMVPDAYKGNAANCMVAMEMSHRIGISVLEVMQNMQPVKGNVGWKSEYVISKINASGIFKEPLEYIFSEDRTECYATATRKNGKVLRGTTVSIAMAKSEGWYGRTGSKWPTMPEQVLMYRAATFFCRVFCPEVLAGVQTADEIIDIGLETPTAAEGSAISKLNDIVKSENTDDNYAFEEIAEEPADQTEAANMDVITEPTANPTHQEDTDF